MEYGMDRIDVRHLKGIVDPDQLYSIGYSLLLAWRSGLHWQDCSPASLARKLVDLVADKGLEVLQSPQTPPIFFAQVRELELSGALSRLRSLGIQ